MSEILVLKVCLLPHHRERMGRLEYLRSPCQDHRVALKAGDCRRRPRCSQPLPPQLALISLQTRTTEPSAQWLAPPLWSDAACVSASYLNLQDWHRTAQFPVTAWQPFVKVICKLYPEPAAAVPKKASRSSEIPTSRAPKPPIHEVIGVGGSRSSPDQM